MPTDIPEDIRDWLTDDRAVEDFPEITTDYWLLAKEMSGNPITPERLELLEALPGTRHVAQAVPVRQAPRGSATVTEIMESALLRTRDVISRRAAPITSCGHGPNGGDAA